MKKLILPKLIAKSHVAAYTKKDGTFVAAHEDKRNPFPSLDDWKKMHPIVRKDNKWHLLGKDGETISSNMMEDSLHTQRNAEYFRQKNIHSEGATDAGKEKAKVAEKKPPRKKSVAGDFNHDRIFYHYTGDKNLKEVDEGKGRFGGVFTLEDKDQASHYGKHGHMFVARGDIFDNDSFSSAIESNERKVRSFVKKELRGKLSPSEISDAIWLVENESRAMGEDPPSGNKEKLYAAFGAYDDSDLYAEAQKLRGSIARLLGASGIHMNDEFGGDSVMLVSRENTKHIGMVGQDTQMTKSVDAVGLKSDPAFRSASSSLALGTKKLVIVRADMVK